MAEEAAKTEEAPKKGGDMKKTIGMVVIGLALGLILGKFVLFKAEPAGTTVIVESQEPAACSLMDATAVALDSKSINLSAGHYAKVQVTVFKNAGDAGHGKAADADSLKATFAKINSDMIAFVQGKPLEEVSTPAFQQELRTFLLEEAHVDYHGAVCDIRISDFVTQ